MARAECWAVTGASGFIGRALVDRLRRDGIAWRGLSKHPEEGLMRGDVRDGAAVRELVRSVTVVVHLAACVHRPVRRAVERAECRSVNVDGTKTVIDAVAEMAPEAFLIFVSTASVYGSAETVVDESAPAHPTTPYGASKLEAETFVRDAIAARQIHGVILRPAMVFGPGAPGNLKRLVSMVRRGLSIQFGRGENRKSLVPIDVLVDAMMTLVAHRDTIEGETFNLAGVTLPIRRINEIIAEALGKRARVIRLPRGPLLLAGRVADLLLRWTALPSFGQMIDAYSATTAISDEKLRSRLSFDPSVDVEGALARVVHELE